jgi:hypothetical protein
MNEFLKILPSIKYKILSCMGFFISPKNVHLKALLYINFYKILPSIEFVK